ncbi:unnamed protein product [Pocillopora meandrina]|uniref:Uncharacterized protein n=1 Tax=Pocillopora meandrina TaxID=46732 RepID=A0AAU9WV05_9CNID|nr:unnamed protein product [Pocillopora meandrina]
MIHKEFPTGIKGPSGTIQGNVQRRWICEKESHNGQGVYFLHPVPRSTNPPGNTTFAKLLQQKGRCQPNRIPLLYQDLQQLCSYQPW